MYYGLYLQNYYFCKDYNAIYLHNIPTNILLFLAVEKLMHRELKLLFQGPPNRGRSETETQVS